MKSQHEYVKLIETSSWEGGRREGQLVACLNVFEKLRTMPPEKLPHSHHRYDQLRRRRKKKGGYGRVFKTLSLVVKWVRVRSLIATAGRIRLRLTVSHVGTVSLIMSTLSGISSHEAAQLEQTTSKRQVPETCKPTKTPFRAQHG